MLKAYKYIIYPTIAQKEQMANIFGQVRFIYNLGLETKISAYASNKINVSYFDLNKQITDLKKDNVYEFNFPKSNKISNKEFYEDTELLMNELHKLIPTLNRQIQKRYSFMK